MSLASMVKKAVASAYKVVGPELAPEVDYVRNTGTVYDATSGTSVETSTTTPVQAILSDPKARASGPDTALGATDSREDLADRKALIQQADLAFKPQEQDHIVLKSGVKYVVSKVTEDPAHATWALFLLIEV